MRCSILIKSHAKFPNRPIRALVHDTKRGQAVPSVGQGSLAPAWRSAHSGWPPRGWWAVARPWRPARAPAACACAGAAAAQTWCWTASRIRRTGTRAGSRGWCARVSGVRTSFWKRRRKPRRGRRARRSDASRARQGGPGVTQGATLAPLLSLINVALPTNHRRVTWQWQSM